MNTNSDNQILNHREARTDEVRQEIRNLKKEVAILKKHKEHNIHDHFIINNALRTIVNNPNINRENKSLCGLMYDLIYTFFYFFFAILKTLIYVFTVFFSLYILSYLVSFFVEQYYLQVYYKPTSNLLWSCSFKEVEVPVFKTTSTCDYKYVDCILFNKQVLIDPLSHTNFKDINDVKNYGFDVIKQSNCTKKEIKFEPENGFYLYRIDTETQYKNDLYYYAHNITIFSKKKTGLPTELIDVKSIILPSTNGEMFLKEYIRQLNNELNN